jgi:hypothetical protein
MFESQLFNTNTLDSSINNPYSQNSLDPLQQDYAKFNSQQLMKLAGEELLDAWQNKKVPNQALIYATASIFNSNFAFNAQIAFGKSFDIQKAQALGADILVGKHGVSPDVEFLSNAEMKGALGAYTQSTNTIYINTDFLANNVENAGAIGKVLVEEKGHFLDAYASPVDSIGDEGEILARLVEGKTFTEDELRVLKAEDDSSVININGKSISVEFSTPNTAPTSLLFNLNNNNLRTTDSLSINGGWVCDINGATDISRVDFRIRTSNGTFIDVADARSFTPNSVDKRWASFNYNLSLSGLNLTAGNYSLWAVAYDKAGAMSNVTQRSFTLTSPNTAPTSLQFNLNNNNLKTTDSLSINGGWVCDINSATDISRVDFRIKTSNGTFIDVADVNSFTANTVDKRWASFNYNLSLSGLNLTAGNYSLWAVAYDKAGAMSNVTEKSFTLTSPNTAPTSLQFNLNSNNLRTIDSLNINGGSVYDGNGATDISRVDFRIKTSNGTFIDVADVNSFTANTVDKRWANFNYNLSLSGLNLTAGNYSLWAVAYDKAGAMSNVTEKNFTLTQPTGDWFNQNLKDQQIIDLTRQRAADSQLSRQDMIDIFRNAQDDNVINSHELIDLRTIVSNFTRFNMTDSVRVLSNKIVNGDVANSNSGIGNLFAGSNATQMENLIGKWFLGSDRPDTKYTYQYVNGSLFQNGIHANDIDQNALGDCYYLATLSSIAQEKSSFIQNMFIDNGDNTFTVRFYNNGVTDYVTVDRYLPTRSNGSAIYAGWGGNYTSANNELWVALAEKAYAQLAESGWSRPSSPSNAYSSIEGGWMDAVIKQVTNLSTSNKFASSMTQTELINLVNSNQILTVGFVYGGGHGVVNNHAYTVTSYNSSNGKFQLRNPWANTHADVTWEQLQSLKAIFQWSNT